MRAVVLEMCEMAPEHCCSIRRNIVPLRPRSNVHTDDLAYRPVSGLVLRCQELLNALDTNRFIQRSRHITDDISIFINEDGEWDRADSETSAQLVSLIEDRWVGERIL